jgi:hypothetical protein
VVKNLGYGWSHMIRSETEYLPLSIGAEMGHHMTLMRYIYQKADETIVPLDQVGLKMHRFFPTSTTVQY